MSEASPELVKRDNILRDAMTHVSMVSQLMCGGFVIGSTEFKFDGEIKATIVDQDFLQEYLGYRPGSPVTFVVSEAPKLDDGNRDEIKMVPIKANGVKVGEAEVLLDGSVKNATITDPEFLKDYFGENPGSSFSLRVEDPAKSSLIKEHKGPEDYPGLSYLLT